MDRVLNNTSPYKHSFSLVNW